MTNKLVDPEVTRPKSFLLAENQFLASFKRKSPTTSPKPKIESLSTNEVYSLDSLRLKIYKNSLTYDSLTDGYQLRITAINSEQKSKISAIAGAFNVSADFKKYNQFAIVQVLYTKTKIYDLGKRIVEATFGCGGLAFIQVNSTESVNTATIFSIAAEVQLKSSEGFINWISLGVSGPKVTAGVSEMAGTLDVKGITNIYVVQDRLQTNLQDTSTKVNPFLFRLVYRAKPNLPQVYLPGSI